MKVFEKFPFLLGLLASLFILLSLMVKSPNSPFNSELAIMGIVFGVVYWIWIVLHIRSGLKRHQYKNSNWLIFAIAAPFFGALLYQIMYERVAEEQQPHAPVNEIAA